VFSVKPKDTITTGTQITNQASVVFDTNAPILTPTWLNTMDVTAPGSAVQALSSPQTSTPFTVSWAGTDTGSGISSYQIWVSDNAGPFTKWIDQTAAPSALYFGQTGHTYGFYSIATDKVGNVQPGKSVADTSTTVSPTAITPCEINQAAPSLADVQLIINQALGLATAANDVNGDGVVNVVDIQIEVNATLGLGCVAN